MTSPREAKPVFVVTDRTGDRSVLKPARRLWLPFVPVDRRPFDRWSVRREVLFLRGLAARQLRRFSVPRIAATDEATFVATTFMGNDVPDWSAPHVVERVVGALLEFQEARVGPAAAARRSSVMSLAGRGAAIPLVTRLLIDLARLRRVDAVASVVRLLGSSAAGLRRKKRWVHGDFKRECVLLDEDDGIVFIDFEKSRGTCRLSFTDIVDFAMDLTEPQLDRAVVRDYVERRLDGRPMTSAERDDLRLSLFVRLVAHAYTPWRDDEMAGGYRRMALEHVAGRGWEQLVQELTA